MFFRLKGVTVGMKKASIHLLVLCLCWLFGCSSTNSPTTNLGGVSNLSGWIVPSKESRYVYRIMNQAHGSSAIQTLFDTVVIVDAGLSRFGKSGVVACADATGLTYYHYESNGDLSQIDSTTPNAWKVFPTSGGPTVTDVTVDSNLSSMTHYHSAGQRLYVGKESVGLLATSYSSLHVLETQAQSYMDSSHTSYDSTLASTDYWFVPSVGTFGKQIYDYSVRNRTANGIYSESGSRSTIELIGYYPK